MKRLILALQFLTRLPMPRVAGSAEDFAASMAWFPVAGLAVGAVVAGSFWLGAQADPWVAALAALTAWVAVTGALHLDGLADLADAKGAAHGDRARLLAVMADPHIGSFGVIAITLQLAAKLVLLHLLSPAQWLALLLIPAVARIGPLVWTRWLPPLHEGLAARFAHAVRPVHLILWALAWLAACYFAPALIGAPLLIGGWCLWLRRSLGGVSGDCHGAGIELLETGLLLALVVAGDLAR
ncbi:adenosylcobinamide-GDP ribazoletransferase [Sphingomonas sp. BT-65]|uniref:adenosylcobinamide-GDP ribazoletransferase n=1 Tax=Sphingomonas sp. BT-65 TaxID=2989821 RepID=UPI002235A3F5|nr:adenosylcobinamide-GDP ribazoletransferase [Sphingomonas sp. BT-65]MCW4461049.1 adenosylcobinamide-GDP ribazoletransferase [Sphingomonas sp. BT-65]